MESHEPARHGGVSQHFCHSGDGVRVIRCSRPASATQWQCLKNETKQKKNPNHANRTMNSSVFPVSVKWSYISSPTPGSLPSGGCLYTSSSNEGWHSGVAGKETGLCIHPPSLVAPMLLSATVMGYMRPLEKVSGG